ncbi:MAG: IS1634 family transposase [Rickettsiales bacterium]|jgi:transposase|nr:IS1634 family transposase [Rickettsiales bacterium]
MSYVFNAGNYPYKYIYLGLSYRDINKQAANKRVRVGIIDPKLHIPIYNAEFFENKELGGIQITEKLHSNAFKEMMNAAEIISKLSMSEKNVISTKTIGTVQKVLELSKDKSFTEDKLIVEKEEIFPNKTKPLQSNIEQNSHVIIIKDDLNNVKPSPGSLDYDNIIEKKIFSIKDIFAASNRKFGAFYLIDGISEQVKLKDTLQRAFPSDWKEIFMLSYYLISTGDAMMYCQNWLDEVEGLPVSLSSPVISRLMASINDNQINNFYNLWGQCRNEVELLALDITYISSYSKQLSRVEYGYNREHDKLRQINACLLFGQTSMLPIYFKPYAGSIKDVSTLKSTLATIYCLSTHKLSLVMDKGFASVKNINEMLTGPLQSNFIISLPFTLNYAKKIAYSLYDTILTSNNVIQTAENTWGITKEDIWLNGSPIYMHAYFNRQKNTDESYRLHSKAQEILDKVKLNGIEKCNLSDIKKYLTTFFDDQGNKSYTVDEPKLDLSAKKSGWFILLSNFITDKKEALHIYRTKDIVEKGFFRLKSQLDLRRLRSHKDNVTDSKLLITFISLILLSTIHKYMSENDLYSMYTVKSLIQEMEKLTITHINNSKFIEPITATQKHILKIFGLKEPNVFELDPSIF